MSGGARRQQVTGQGDLFAEQEEADQAARAAAAPCIYDSPARGVQARVAEFEAWCAEFGRFDSYHRSHAWRPGVTPPASPGRCQVWTLSASVDASGVCDGHGGSGIAYRGCCLGCDWEGPPREDENEAAEDGCDHAWPGWRELPVVAQPPFGGAAGWVGKVTEVYPPGWVEAGGPVRTRRSGAGTRSHYASQWRGFDMCGEVVPEGPPDGRPR